MDSPETDLHLPPSPASTFWSRSLTFLWPLLVCVLLLLIWGEQEDLLWVYPRWILALLVCGLAIPDAWNFCGPSEVDLRHRGRMFLLLCFCLLLWLAPGASPWFFFVEWGHADGVFRDACYQWMLATLLLIPVFSFLRIPQAKLVCLLAGLLLISAVLSMEEALDTLNGLMLYRSDHPSFMCRLHEFVEAFPMLGGYNPWWNAGTEHFTGVTSGVQGIGLLFYPLLKAVSVHSVYNLLVVFLFAGLTPLLAVLSARAVGFSPMGMAVTGLLAMAVSLGFFQWMWHFGTLGAAWSAVLLLPVLALSYRGAVRGHTTVPSLLALALSVWLMAMWAPLGLLVGGSLVVAFLLPGPHRTLTSFRFLAAAAVLALLAFLPWIRVILFPARGVVYYVNTSPESTLTFAQGLWAGGQNLLHGLVNINPGLLFLGVGGLFFAPWSLRTWVMPLLILALLIAGWIPVWKPFSQFERFVIPFSFACVLPAAHCLTELLEREVTPAWGRAAALAFLLLLSRNVVLLYANEGPAPAQTLQPVVPELTEWIREEVPRGGRVLFAGQAVHFYGGGKIAYLPILTGREMMADDYYGFPHGTIEFNYPPRPYRLTPDRFLDFVHAYNVTHLLTAHDEFRSFFATDPEIFEPQKEFRFREARITGYRVERQKPLLPVNGRVSAEMNRLRLTDLPLETGSVVIPYQWRNGLYSRSGPAEIRPFVVDEQIRLIEVLPNGESRVDIGYRMPWGQVAPNPDGRFHH